MVTRQQEAISASKGMANFGEDVVVSMGKYFWSKKDKAMMKKGTNRTREGIIKHAPTLNQVIWKSDSHDINQGSLDIIAAMGDFARANFDSISQLNKDILVKE